MRLGELLTLEVGDFDFVQNRINISKNKMFINSEVSMPKTTCSIRVVDMLIGVMKAVKEYIERLDEMPTPLFDMYNSVLSVTSRRFHNQ